MSESERISQLPWRVAFLSGRRAAIIEKLTRRSKWAWLLVFFELALTVGGLVLAPPTSGMSLVLAATGFLLLGISVGSEEFEKRRDERRLEIIDSELSFLLNEGYPPGLVQYESAVWESAEEHRPEPTSSVMPEEFVPPIQVASEAPTLRAHEADN